MVKDNNGKSRDKRHPPPPPWVRSKGESESETDPKPEIEVLATGGTAPPLREAPEAQAVPGAPSSYLVTARRNATDFIRGSFAITPDDANGLAKPSLGLWVGGAGNLAVKLQDGSTATFTAVPAGTMLPVVATQVLATGTTATLLVGLR
jgi:hypothetical protein